MTLPLVAPAYGLTPTGFKAPTIDDILGAIVADQAAAGVPSGGPIAGLNISIARQILAAWQLCGQIAANRDPAYLASLPDGTQSAAVDALCAITGTRRTGRTFGLVTLTVRLLGNVTLPAGSMASSSGSTARWATKAAVFSDPATLGKTTIASGSNNVSLPQSDVWVASTANLPPSGSVTIMTSAGLQTVNYSGTSGGDILTGCTGGTGTMSTGNAVTSTSQFLSVLAECTVAGPVAAGASTITVIATPVNGWLSVTNDTSATPGSNGETDSQLLARRQVELTPRLETTIPSILATCLEATFPSTTTLLLSTCIVEENTDDHAGLPLLPPPGPARDAFIATWPFFTPVPTEQQSERNFGRAAHSVETLVQFASAFSDVELVIARVTLAQVLFDSIAVGIATYSASDTSAYAIDGNSIQTFVFVELSCTLTAGTTLPTDSVAFDGSGNAYATMVTATNSGGSPAVLVVPARCLNASVGVVAAHSITSPGGAPGWTAVDNPVPSVQVKGALQLIAWSEVQSLPIYASVTILAGPGYGGDGAVATNIANYIQGLPLGAEVRPNQIIAAAMRVAGVIDVTAIGVGTAPSPTGTLDIPVGARARASVAAGGIVITSAVL